MKRTERILWSGGSILTILILWWISSVLFPRTIPDLLGTGSALVEILTQPGPFGKPFYYHVFMTVIMILLSVVISLVAGTVIGVALGSTPSLEDAMSSWVYIWLAIPSLVIVFITGVWVGYRPLAGYVAVPIVITPFVTLNMWEGTKDLNRNLNEMADFFGASWYQKFTDVIIPQLTPYLFASVRSALSVGWKITLLVEAFLLGRGVGFMFQWYFNQFNLTKMVGWIIIFVVFLMVVEYGIVVPLQKQLTHWRPDGGAIKTGG
jgi:NitT/TauT family transport system permease protein